MSALSLGSPKTAAHSCQIFSRRAEASTKTPASFPYCEQLGLKIHKLRGELLAVCLHRSNLSLKRTQRSLGGLSVAGTELHCKKGRFGLLLIRRVRASASESSETRGQSEDELTLGDRLNAISHKRSPPSLHGASRGFGSEPGDLSLTKKRLNLPDSVRPPPSIKASNRPDVVGVLGGISPRATADFMRQVIQATPANSNKDHVPLIVSSIPQIPSLSAPILNRPAGPDLDQAVVSPLPAMLETRRFLEQSGAKCIVMPSNMAHFWYDQLALDCSVPFLHVADAVAEELDMARLEPLEAGSQPKIGLLAGEATLKASIYQQKLEARGYTVVLPDRNTMAHAVVPGMEALERGDTEGAKNLLGIGIQVLLVNAVNVVILAFSEASSVFPPSDPILKRCLSPTAALARATVRWVLTTRAESVPDA